MDELNIFNGYLTGEEREDAIAVAEANNMIDRGLALLEMCIIQEEQILKDVELKVFKESGTYDDYSYLLTEAENAAEEKKQGAITTIIEGIKQLFSSIFRGIAGLFKKADPNASVQIDASTKSALDLSDSIGNAVGSLGDSLSSGGVVQAIQKVEEFFKNNKKPVLATAGAGATITVAVLQQKFNILDSARQKINTGLDAIKNKFSKKEETKEENEQSLITKISNKLKSIANEYIQPLLDKIKNALMSAGQTVKNAASNVADAAKNTAGKVKNIVTGGNNATPDATASAPGETTPNATSTPQGGTAPVQPQQQVATAAQNYATQPNTNQAQQPQTREYSALPQDGDQGRKYMINVQGQIVGIKDAYNNPLDPNTTPIPPSVQRKIEQIKATGKLESAEDIIFDEDYYTIEFSEEDQAYIITDTREPELTIEQSIYGDLEDDNEEESLADLFNSL